jgi:hypothetical protein
MEFKIESDIPIPNRGHSSEVTLVLHQLEVGQSVLIPSEGKNIRNTVASVARKTRRRFTTREIDKDTVRVWRTE